jgi:hypothetical protein
VSIKKDFTYKGDSEEVKEERKKKFKKRDEKIYNSLH